MKAMLLSGLTGKRVDFEEQRLEALKKDPLAPKVEGAGIVLMAALKEIHVKGAWESHGLGKGREVRSRVMKLLKEQVRRSRSEVCVVRPDVY